MKDKLKLLQKEQKARAKSKGAWPKDKIIEECCEVLLDHLEDKNTDEEEYDLLMCLIDKHMGSDGLKKNWLRKLESRGRAPTPNQLIFLNS